MAQTTVNAARLHEPGAPLRIDAVPLAGPGEDEVLVDLRFGGVNPIDRYTAEGQVAADGPLPRTLGGEAAGRLEGQPVLVTGEQLGAARTGCGHRRPSSRARPSRRSRTGWESGTPPRWASPG